jgi:hypothetical protein
MEDLLFRKELMFQYRVDVYKNGLVEFYEWQCNHHSYDGMFCNHEGECIKAKLGIERYNINNTGTLLCIGDGSLAPYPNDMLMESWAEIKSMYREYKFNEIGI